MPTKTTETLLDKEHAQLLAHLEASLAPGEKSHSHKAENIGWCDCGDPLRCPIRCRDCGEIDPWCFCHEPEPSEERAQTVAQNRRAAITEALAELGDGESPAQENKLRAIFEAALAEIDAA